MRLNLQLVKGPASPQSTGESQRTVTVRERDVISPTRQEGTRPPSLRSGSGCGVGGECGWFPKVRPTRATHRSRWNSGPLRPAQGTLEVHSVALHSTGQDGPWAPAFKARPQPALVIKSLPGLTQPLHYG